MAIVVGLALAPPAQADPVLRWRPFVIEASDRFGLPMDWIERVMRAESGGRPRLGGRPIRSPKGAIGLMQLMPATWLEVRDRLGLGADPDDPRDNILAGAFYLRAMYDRFGYPGCFAAYNAGPGRYRAWLAGRGSLPRETLAYVARLGSADASRGSYAAAPPLGLFVVRHGDDVEARPDGQGSTALFLLREDAE